jgi:hypothetical protein
MAFSILSIKEPPSILFANLASSPNPGAERGKPLGRAGSIRAHPAVPEGAAGPGYPLQFLSKRAGAPFLLRYFREPKIRRIFGYLSLARPGQKTMAERQILPLKA